MPHRSRPPASALTAVVMAAAVVLAGCATPPPPPVAPPAPVAPVVVAPPPETAASAAQRTHYAEVQSALLSQGLLRTDGGGIDAPFTDRMLTENFLKIALYEEYAYGQISATRSQSAITLLRWDKPIRLSVQFGASISCGQTGGRPGARGLLSGPPIAADRAFHHRDRPEPQLLAAFRIS